MDSDAKKVRGAKRRDEDVAALIAVGGEPIAPTELRLPEDFVDDDLLASIGALVAGGSSAKELEAVLDAPANKISAVLRRERRKLSLLLLSGVGRNLTHFTPRYYKLLGKVFDELEGRDVTTMDTTVLLRFASVIARMIAPIQDAVALRPPVDNQLAGQNIPVTAQTVNLLVSQAHQAKERADDAVEIRKHRELPTRERAQGSNVTVPPMPED